MPAIWLLIANGLSSMPNRARTLVGSAAIVLLVYGIATFSFGPSQAKEDWRAATELIQDAEADEVLIVRTLQMVIPMAYYFPEYERFEAIEINRNITPISQLASRGSGSWLLYWNPASDAHSVAARLDPDLERDSNPEVLSWMSGQGPPILERAEFPGLTVFHFDGQQP